MKSFKSSAWVLPQPVLIIGTYDKNGKPNATTENLEANGGEFTVAFATKETMVAAEYVGIASAKKDAEKYEGNPEDWTHNDRHKHQGTSYHDTSYRARNGQA